MFVELLGLLVNSMNKNCACANNVSSLSDPSKCIPEEGLSEPSTSFVLVNGKPC